jgi:hypothetical protein
MLPIRRKVVSAPAGMSSRRKLTTSSSVRPLPSTRPVTSLLITSSPGSARRFWITGVRYSRIACEAAIPRS